MASRWRCSRKRVSSYTGFNLTGQYKVYMYAGGASDVMFFVV